MFLTVIIIAMQPGVKDYAVILNENGDNAG